MQLYGTHCLTDIVLDACVCARVHEGLDSLGESIGTGPDERRVSILQACVTNVQNEEVSLCFSPTYASKLINIISHAHKGFNKT